jgi:hypothetical protein
MIQPKQQRRKKTFVVVSADELGLNTDALEYTATPQEGCWTD